MAILRANLFFKFHLIVFQLCDSSFMNIAEQNTNPQPFFKNRWIDHFFTVNKSLNQFTVQTLTYFYNQTADSVCVCVCVCVCSSVWLFCDPMDCSLPGSSVHRISKQEYWTGLTCPPPGDLPDPETKPASPALQSEFFITEPSDKLSEIALNWSIL